MELTKERLQEKLEPLQKRVDQMRADLNATQGAMQMLQLLLQEIDQPEPTVEPVEG